jgi:hypothetical protein
MYFADKKYKLLKINPSFLNIIHLKLVYTISDDEICITYPSKNVFNSWIISSIGSLGFLDTTNGFINNINDCPHFKPRVLDENFIY